MNRLESIKLVAFREVRERTRSRMFRISTFMTVLIVVAAVVFPALAQQRDRTPVYSVALVPPAAPQLDNAIIQTGPSIGARVSVSRFSSKEDAEMALRANAVQLIVVPSRELVTRVAIDPNIVNGVTRLVAAISEAVRLYDGLTRAGLSADTTWSALHEEPLPVRGLQEAPHRNSKDASAASGGMIVLFVFLTLYGAFILNGVIEEKTSRVVEVLLSTVRPNELLMGKVAGIALVGSINGVLLAVATFVARSATHSTAAASLTPAVLAYTMLWFLLGFGMYAWLYACAGALVSRSEDAQSLVFPLQVPLVVSYGAGLVSAVNGPTSASVALSMFPLTAPMTMLERMAAQEAPLWQVLLSIGLCLATIYLVMRLAITIFAGGILRSGQRVKLREAWSNRAT